jgi:hypothetical protein
MHSYTTGTGRRFHTDGDFRGMVLVQVGPDEVKDGLVELPWRDLVAIVAEKVRYHRDDADPESPWAWDRMTPEQVLDIPTEDE